MKISLALASTAISGSSAALACAARRRSATPASRSSHSGYVASPILLHGNSAEHAGLHHAVSFALFLLPFADLAQGLFDLIARDLRLRLFLILFLLVGLVWLFLLLLFLIFLLLILLL